MTWKIDKCFMTGCDSKTEWLLEWFIDNYLKYRETRYNALLSLGYTPNNIEYSLLSNISVGAAFCRIKYLRDRKPIPSWDDVEAQAAYWKRVYNTELGKGTIEHFIKANDGYFESLPSQ